MAMTSASVDRLNQVPARLAFLFDYDADAVAARRAAARGDAQRRARAVAHDAGRRAGHRRGSTASDFRRVGNAVRARTEQKAKALFHPIRLVLTGRRKAPGSISPVPAIDRGAEPARVGRHPGGEGQSASGRPTSVRALDALIPNP